MTRSLPLPVLYLARLRLAGGQDVRAPISLSAMTGRATRQNVRCLNVILLLPIHAFGDFGFCAVSRSPFHVENLFFWSHEVFRGAMALETPFHLQRISLRHYRHLIDAAMAGGTAHAFIDVNRM